MYLSMLRIPLFVVWSNLQGEKMNGRVTKSDNYDHDTYYR